MYVPRQLTWAWIGVTAHHPRLSKVHMGCLLSHRMYVPRHLTWFCLLGSPKDDLHTELLQRMSMGKNRNVHKAPKSPMLYINPESTWQDVEEWLMSKAFSQRWGTPWQTILSGVSGDQGQSKKLQYWALSPGALEGHFFKCPVECPVELAGFYKTNDPNRTNRTLLYAM
jgi:hypothetical protein